jgi:para-nitrobenzyl esterase
MKAMVCCTILGLLAAVIAAGHACAQATEAARPTATVIGGKIQGRMLPAGGAVFKGIPYAEPPGGDLRWREPAPVKPWNGMRDASVFGAACVQWNQPTDANHQEDCLYLNVWTSQWPVRAKMPVMFWIHGGSNVFGTASDDSMDGASLSRKGVVVVTINYRVGVFGFLAHPALTAESPHHASSNYGMLDLVAGLKWVHENIAQFGGDPGNITVFGQSAGAVDTGFLAASPLARGLFQRAIQESGPIVRYYTWLHDAEKEGEKIAAILKTPSGPEALKFLRELPAEQVRRAYVEGRGPQTPALAIVDGWFMPDSAEQIFADGKQNPVSLIVGTNSQELGRGEQSDLRKGVVDEFGINADKALDYYGLTSPGEGNSDPLFGSATIQMLADTKQRCGLIQQAIWHAASNYPTYEYQYDHAPPGKAAPSHGSEVPYVFGNLQPRSGSSNASYTEADRKLSDIMQTYWTNFAKTGNPNGAGLPNWPRFDPKERDYLEFADGGSIVANTGLRRKICDLYMENWQQRMKATKASQR